MPAFKQKIRESNKPNNISLLSSIPDWTITNSLRAAYLTWDRSKNSATSKIKTKREFDYGEFPLEKFYNLILKTNLEFSTETLEQAATIGIEVNKIL